MERFSPGLEIANPQPGLLDAALDLVTRAYPQWYIDEVAEDLEGLCRIFGQAEVSVIRPSWTEQSTRFQSPNWQAAGFDIYNVRDLHIVFGDTLIVSAPSSRFRLFENYAFHDIFYQHFFEEGFRWISAPIPRLRGKYLHEVDRESSPLEVLEDSLHQKLSSGLKETYHFLHENEVIFDAANIIRVGRDILFLRNLAETGPMDKFFDDLAKILATQMPRRKAFRFVGGALAAAVMGVVAAKPALAAQCTAQSCPSTTGKCCGTGANAICCATGTCCASKGSTNTCCAKGRCVCSNGTCGVSSGGQCGTGCGPCA